MALRVALVGLLLLLAGCTTPDAGTLDEAGAALDAGPELPEAEVFEITFGMAAAVQTPVFGASLLPAGSPENQEFPVRAGATGLTARAEWSCTSGPVCSLDMVLRPVGEPNQAVATGSGSAEATLASPAAGAWGAYMFASQPAGAVIDVTGTITIEVQYGGDE